MTTYEVPLKVARLSKLAIRRYIKNPMQFPYRLEFDDYGGMWIRPKFMVVNLYRRKRRARYRRGREKVRPRYRGRR
jgi:hypothetical protein